ncbi:hypothetical protein BDN67DRAFT_992550 [Paxillus ammoniavirescens]|nr:hypothetical protein BDN67DRAFT_992550 [Paxillus ammoniavirescens]
MAKQAASNTQREPVFSTPEQHHHISQSQNYPKDLMRLAWQTSDDPAMKNFILKLKAHLLPRVKALHHNLDPTSATPSSIDDPAQTHDLSSLNQDVVNPSTDHCDIMLLSNSESHSFSYACVLGIYHGNIIYCGPGSLDYKPCWLEFLWVRWFELIAPTCQFALDKLHFVPMVDEEAFGFVDPSNVLQSCHLIPGFSAGKLHRDDSDDWKWYYVNRVVDRYMLLQYHLGMGIDVSRLG